MLLKEIVVVCCGSHAKTVLGFVGCDTDSWMVKSLIRVYVVSTVFERAKAGRTETYSLLVPTNAHFM